MLDKHIYYVPTESRAADWGSRSGDVLCMIQYYNDCIISIILMISGIMYYTVLLFIMYCICILYFYTLMETSMRTAMAVTASPSASSLDIVKLYFCVAGHGAKTLFPGCKNT